MKKSKLIKENFDLYERLKVAKQRTADLEKDLKTVKSELEVLKAENARLADELKAKNDRPTEDIKGIEAVILPESEPGTVLPKPVTAPLDADIADVPLKDDMQYAADIIGDIVIESAKFSNRLTENGNSQHIELVNLVLGKTEVSKADILAIIREDIPLIVKKQKIDAVKASTIEYFESVMGQIS